MPLFIERWYPLLLSGLIGSGYLLFPIAPQLKDLNNFFSVLISVSSIMLGFLFTAKSILFSIQDKEAIKRLKSSLGFIQLVKYILSAIHGCFFLTLAGGYGMLSGDSGKSVWFLAILFSLITYALLTSYRAIHLFYKLLIKAE